MGAWRVIPIQRTPAPADLTEKLERSEKKTRAWAAEGKTVRDVWNNGADAAKKRIRELLLAMAPARKRCMYCLDNRGTDIDHFQPIALAPHRAFDWLNHLLACSYCNSNLKRDAYPCDDDSGEALLIDPTAEDPAIHLTLRLGSCEYETRTRKGEETIRVFGLNDRSELVDGRRMAYKQCGRMLELWQRYVQEDELREAGEVARDLRQEPFAHILRAMERLLSEEPGLARRVFKPRVHAALVGWMRVSTDT